jgi:hypothetical protein
MQGGKTGFYRNKSMQTGSSGTLIGWKSGQTTFVPLWDRMEVAWLRTRYAVNCLIREKQLLLTCVQTTTERLYFFQLNSLRLAAWEEGAHGR